MSDELALVLFVQGAGRRQWDGGRGIHLPADALTLLELRPAHPFGSFAQGRGLAEIKRGGKLVAQGEPVVDDLRHPIGRGHAPRRAEIGYGESDCRDQRQPAPVQKLIAEHEDQDRAGHGHRGRQHALRHGDVEEKPAARPPHQLADFFFCPDTQL